MGRYTLHTDRDCGIIAAPRTNISIFRSQRHNSGGSFSRPGRPLATSTWPAARPTWGGEPSLPGSRAFSLPGMPPWRTLPVEPPKRPAERQRRSSSRSSHCAKRILPGANSVLPTNSPKPTTGFRSSVLQPSNASSATPLSGPPQRQRRKKGLHLSNPHCRGARPDAECGSLLCARCPYHQRRETAGR